MQQHPHQIRRDHRSQSKHHTRMHMSRLLLLLLPTPHTPARIAVRYHMREGHQTTTRHLTDAITFNIRQLLPLRNGKRVHILRLNAIGNTKGHHNLPPLLQTSRLDTHHIPHDSLPRQVQFLHQRHNPHRSRTLRQQRQSTNHQCHIRHRHPGQRGTLKWHLLIHVLLLYRNPPLQSTGNRSSVISICMTLNWH